MGICLRGVINSLQITTNARPGAASLLLPKLQSGPSKSFVLLDN